MHFCSSFFESGFGNEFAEIACKIMNGTLDKIPNKLKNKKITPCAQSNSSK